MIAAVRDGKLLTMEGDYDHIVNRGSLCVKGISMFATHASPNRLTTPRYRAPGSDHWEDISWDDAISAGRAEDSEDARRDLDRHREGRRQGGSGQSDGRDRLPGRRAEHERGVLPLPEGGPAARPGVRRAPGPTLTQPHGPRSGGLVRAGAMTNHWIDLQNCKTILVEGSNVAENHPMAFKWIRKAQENGAKIIHVDPRYTRTSSAADVYARIRPGTDAAFQNTMINHIIVNKLYDEDYVVTHTNALFLGDEAFDFKRWGLQRVRRGAPQVRHQDLGIPARREGQAACRQEPG